MITEPEIGEFFREIGWVVPASGALLPLTPDDRQRLAAAASRHHHWLATPEENAAVGTAMP